MIKAFEKRLEEHLQFDARERRTDAEVHSTAERDSVLAVNVKAVFHLTRFLHEPLERAATATDPARVINIGSIDGLHVPAVENYSYTASKTAVHHLTRHLARRLAPRVTVNALALGPFESEMTSAAIGKEISLRVPLRRIDTPEDVAGP